VMLAVYYLQQRDPKQAMDWAQQAQSIAPDSPQALDALGSAQIMAGEKENALTSFRKLAAAAPDNPVAHYKLAAVYAAMQNMPSTRASVNRALVLKPDYEEAQVLLGFTELNAKHFTEAVRLAQQVEKQHPESAAGYMLEGDALLADKKFAQAEPLYQKALAINGNPLLAMRAHEAGTAAGHPKEADAALQRWLEDTPNDTMARSYFASALARNGQNAQAIEQMQKVVQIQPKNPAAVNELALLYQKAGDSRALATAEQAQQLAPDRPEVLDTLGWVLVQQGQAARGVELLQNAAAKAPNMPAIRYHLAAGLAKNGDKVRARREVETVLQDKTFTDRADAERLLKSLQ
jgi:putative PEP-CTERM system TPR-repeat lipoprotein